MRKKFLFLGLFSLIISIIISTVFFYSFNENYYEKMYDKLAVADTLSITNKELFEVNDKLLSYIKGQENNLDYSIEINGRIEEFFNQREKDHMIDVQDLYLNANKIRIVSFSIALLSFVFAFINKIKKNEFAEVLGKVLLSYGFIIGSILIYAVLDFDSFWTTFHHLIFSNDLWLLDHRTDRLINMVPLEFFMGIVFRILLTLVIVFMVLFLIKKKLEKDDNDKYSIV